MARPPGTGKLGLVACEPFCPSPPIPAFSTPSWGLGVHSNLAPHPKPPESHFSLSFACSLVFTTVRKSTYAQGFYNCQVFSHMLIISLPHSNPGRQVALRVVYK